MPRQRMEPGQWGKITVKQVDKTVWKASAYVRDLDGKRRHAEAVGISEEDSRRTLQTRLRSRELPTAGAKIDRRSTLDELFGEWLETKRTDNLAPQSIAAYKDMWDRYGTEQLGSLRITELSTRSAEQYLRVLKIRTVSGARRIRIILTGMYKLAARYDIVSTNPMRETSQPRVDKPPTRALTPEEFARVRVLVKAYSERTGPGPKPGRLLPEFVEVLAATGARPSEVLGLRWSDVDLLGDPPTVTISGTLITAKTKGAQVRRQEHRKGKAPQHTVVLPPFGVEALTAAFGSTGSINGGPVFPNRNGDWMSLANLRRAWRAALSEEFAWLTPHSLRRTVATVVRDEFGLQAAQQQLSHSKAATTEAHYLQRVTRAPDVTSALTKFSNGSNGSNGSS